MTGRLVRLVLPIGFAAAVIAAWWLLVLATGVPESSLPSPRRVLSAFSGNWSLLLDNAWVTITEVLLGYLAAVILGVAVATVIASSKLVERSVYPWLVASQMVPIVAIAPIIVIWTGFDLRPKVIVIALVSFFPIAVNTIDGLRSTDPDLIDMLRTHGANRRQRFRIAQFPASLPFLFSGMKVAAALSVIGAVFAEWVGSSEGLGYLILTFNNQTATAEMFAAVALLAIIGIGLFLVIAALERVVLPWYYDPRRFAHQSRSAGQQYTLDMSRAG
jgi:ABC-type nitrate/sulfonate/bicarbonate transport system permease component